MSQNAIDVTDLHSFDKQSLTASLDPADKAASNAEHFNRARMHEAINRILSDQRSRLRNLFNQAPGFMAVLTGEKYVFEIVNEGQADQYRGTDGADAGPSAVGLKITFL